MKSFRCLLALLLIICLIFSFSACSKATPEDSTAAAPDASEGDHHLKIVADYNTMRWGCGTSKGYYDSIMWPLDMYEEKSDYIHISNLMYTDYASHTRVYLCNTPGCAHNNENCTSYIKYSAGLLLFCDANEKYLFCISSGAIQGEAESEEEIGSLIRCNLDGSNRVELLKLKPTESFSYVGKVFSDEENIYLIVLEYDTQNDEVYKVLRRINIETGEFEDINKCPTTVFFSGVFQDKYLIKLEYEDANLNVYQYSPYNQTEQKIALCDVSDESNVRGFDSKEVATANWSLNEGLLSVSSKDLETGIKKELDGMPCNPAGGISWDLYEKDLGYLKMSFIEAETEEHIEYLIDFNENTYSKNELYYINTPYKMPFQVISAFGDKYMVIIGESEKKTITQVDQNGVAHTYEYEGRPLYATMLKEDYWNQNPVYEIIDDQI